MKSKIDILVKSVKIFKTILLIIFLIASGYTINAQDKGVWKNKKCAVSLTYDDALNVHLDNVIPVLNSLDFRGTFYVPGYFPGFSSRLNDWKAAAAKEHELGNHTLFHPCEGKAPGREWVNPVYDLSVYSGERMVDEIKMANILLSAIDGKTKRTFAYTCGDIMAGDSNFVPGIINEFVGARSVSEAMPKIYEIDLFNIPSYMIAERSGDELINLVKEAIKNKGLLVFLFHGVGGEHSINVSLEAHNKILHFLKENEKDIWIAPLVEISEYVKNYNENK